MTRTRRSSPKPARSAEQQLLLTQVRHIAQGLGQTLAPFCEIVVHDLLEPDHAVLEIHNNLSGRAAGDAATELGLARLADPDFAPVVANYPNRFADGRPAKSTSIGIQDSSGRYIAALCLNVDLTLFNGLHSAMSQFMAVQDGVVPRESLDSSGADAIRARIDRFAASRASTPRALKAGERRALMAELKTTGLLDVRRAMETVAAHLGVSRAAVYLYAK